MNHAETTPPTGKVPAASQAFDRFVGIETDLTEPGRCRLSLVVRPELRQPQGLLHGGITATLMDTATAYALFSTLPEGSEFATTELSIYYLRPVREGRVTAEARIVHLGRSSALLEMTVTTEDGKTAARGMSRYAILKRGGDDVKG